VEGGSVGNGAVETEWFEYRGRWTRERGEVIDEVSLSIYVNGVEFATFMSSPGDQIELALGFLKNEGFIDRMDEVRVVTTSENVCCVDVWLDKSVAKPERFVITSGCGGGMTFDNPSDVFEPLEDDLRIDPATLFDLQRSLYSSDALHARAGGIHTSGLSDGKTIFLTVEDVGRHNTIDRLAGACLLHGIETRGRIILSTGRISSEMMRKGARMGCSMVCSRTSPTSMSVIMARAWGITLVGYARGNRMRVYSHPERLGLSPGTALPAAIGASRRQGT
jgi:FdhD protein